MLHAPKWAPAVCLALASCRQAVVEPEKPSAPAEWFRVTLGVSDKTPTDWSGSVDAGTGRVAAVTPFRFDKGDSLTASTSWKCSSRRADTPIPQDWFVGALHVVPKDMKRADGAMVPNGVHVAVANAAEVRITTRQGSFAFRPAEVMFGRATMALDGRVSIERMPAARDWTSTSGRQDDYPAAAADPDGNAWIAWISYQAEREQIVVGSADGSQRRVVAHGEFFRPAMAASQRGAFALAFSVNTGGTWKAGVVMMDSNGWGGVEVVSNGGPDLHVQPAFDSRGRLWLVWQGFREGRSRILAKVREQGGAWGPEIKVSENWRNAWEPAIAPDPDGGVHFAWDAYDRGDYDIFYRRHDGRKLLPQYRVTKSPLREARASIAVDQRNRAWIAWDEGGANWGKDTGFLVNPRNGATRLYESRRVRVAVMTDGGLRAVAQPEGPLEMPRLSAGPDGGIWMIAQHRETKLHAVYSQSLKRDRLQQYSFWGYAAASFSGASWSPLTHLGGSWGRNDTRGAIAALPRGRALVAWAGDGRTYSQPYPGGTKASKSNVWSGEVGGARAAEPVLSEEQPVEPEPVPEPPAEGESAEPEPRRGVHPREAWQIARMKMERVKTGGKTLRLLRGDMHRHTDLSFDGDIDGSVWDFYRYCIDAAGFEYSALTEHNSGDDDEYLWWIIQKSNDLYHYPGTFTPIYAYERSLRFPNGHRNLIWAKRGVRTLPRTKAEEEGTEGAARLYAYLKETGGLAMSHTSATLMGTDWRDNDPDVEPLVEIYQGDRTSYEHEGAFKAAVKDKPLTQPGGFKPEGFVWNAWAKGYKLGVQASSDHASTHVSYAVLIAEDQTREGILAAIKARHAYAATDNIVLSFRSGDRIQGDSYTTRTRPEFQVIVEGTASIAKIDIIKNGKYVYQKWPGERVLWIGYVDRDAEPGESYYYVRVYQADGQMAWSSPIWVKYDPPPEPAN